MKRRWAILLAAGILVLGTVWLSAEENTGVQQAASGIQTGTDLQQINLAVQASDAASGPFIRPRGPVGQRLEGRPVVPPENMEAGPAADPLRELIASAKVGRARDSGDFRVFVLTLDGPRYDAETWTLDQAIAHKALEITEKEGGTVPTLLATNRSDRRVFLMAGELVLGGKQDRIVRQDVVVPPRTDRMEIPVYCGQQGRWTMETSTFQTKGSAANLQVRKKAVSGKSQGEVWSQIDATLEKNAKASGSSKLQEVLEDEGAQRDVARVAADCLSKRSRNEFGMVVTHRGRILGVDLFGSHELFDGLAEKVLSTYVVEVRPETDGKGESVTEKQVRDFLAQLGDATIERAQTVGMGQAYILRAGDTEGGGLVVNGQAVHIAAIK